MLYDGNKRFLQVERVADYTPSNRQVEPSPVPTDYADQLHLLSTALNTSTYNALASRVNTLELVVKPSTVLSFQLPTSVSYPSASRNVWFELSEAQWPGLTVAESGPYHCTISTRMSQPSGPDTFWAVRIARTSAAGAFTALSANVGTNDGVAKDHSTSAQWYGTLNVGDVIRPQWFIAGTGTSLPE